ncbi:hypothetical protein QYF36_010251 [Acer negundo]|nr:hypothetical protein QYF36_010251 [Acer negundo]
MAQGGLVPDWFPYEDLVAVPGSSACSSIFILKANLYDGKPNSPALEPRAPVSVPLEPPVPPVPIVPPEVPWLDPPLMPDALRRVELQQWLSVYFIGKSVSGVSRLHSAGFCASNIPTRPLLVGFLTPPLEEHPACCPLVFSTPLAFLLKDESSCSYGEATLPACSLL